VSVLSEYFSQLLKRVEANEDVVSNQGKDNEGFYKPTRTILLRHINLLRDLNEKPLAKPMLKTAWEYVVEHLPPEYLVLNEEQKSALKKMLS